MYASLVLDKSDPRKIIDDRISLIISSGMVFSVISFASTISVSFSRLTFAPRYSRILIEASTSVKSGTLCIILTPLINKVDARIGKTEFFAP